VEAAERPRGSLGPWTRGSWWRARENALLRHEHRLVNDALWTIGKNGPDLWRRKQKHDDRCFRVWASSGLSAPSQHHQHSTRDESLGPWTRALGPRQEKKTATLEASGRHRAHALALERKAVASCPRAVRVGQQGSPDQCSTAHRQGRSRTAPARRRRRRRRWRRRCRCPHPRTEEPPRGSCPSCPPRTRAPLVGPTRSEMP